MNIETKKCVNPLANTIINAIEVREKKLLKNPVLVSAIYLDPRFKFLLSTDENIVAQNHLMQLYDNYMNINIENNSEVTTSQPSTSQISTSLYSTLQSSTSQPPTLQSLTSQSSALGTSNKENSSENDLLNYLNDIDENMNSTNSINNVRKAAYQEIKNYAPARILDTNINILNYWKIKNTEFRTLAVLANIVHAVPATQVSVERSFSALKFIYSDQRSQLSASNMENILLVKLNKNFKR